MAEANALEAETQLNAPVDGGCSQNLWQSFRNLSPLGVPVVSIIQNDIWVSLTVRENQYASIYQLKQLQGYIPALDQYMLFNIKNIDAEGEFATIKRLVKWAVMIFEVLKCIWCLPRRILI